MADMQRSRTAQPACQEACRPQGKHKGELGSSSLQPLLLTSATEHGTKTHTRKLLIPAAAASAVRAREVPSGMLSVPASPEHLCPCKADPSPCGWAWVGEGSAPALASSAGAGCDHSLIAAWHRGPPTGRSPGALWHRMGPPEPPLSAVLSVRSTVCWAAGSTWSPYGCWVCVRDGGTF